MTTTSTARLPRSTPETQGIPSSAISNFVDAVEANKLTLHSFMMLRHGAVVAEGWWEPYGPEYIHVLFSLSKSFTSTAVGFAVAEGYFTLEDKVISFFPDETPADASDNLRAMNVRHLLAMYTGHSEDTTGPINEAREASWVETFLAQPVTYEPGTHFLYNSGATYMLSAIVQKCTGQTLLEYLGPRLLQPLGIEGATWQSSPQGINTGGWGMSVRTEDIACFGQLYLQNGVWHGTQLLPDGWVAEATTAWSDNSAESNPDWSQGYGYQFWRCRHGAYRGDGAFGQYCVVMPDQETVLAITSGLQNMQAVLDLVWEHLLPAIGHDPLPEDASAQEALRNRMSSLVLPMPAGTATSPTAARVSGRSYAVAANDQGITAIRCDFGADGAATLTISDADGEHSVDIGSGAWRRGTTTLEGNGGRRSLVSKPSTQHVAASGAWSDDTTYVAQVWFYETPFALTHTLRFGDDDVTMGSELNVSFGPTDRGEVVGKAE